MFRLKNAFLSVSFALLSICYGISAESNSHEIAIKILSSEFHNSYKLSTRSRRKPKNLVVHSKSGLSAALTKNGEFIPCGFISELQCSLNKKPMTLRVHCDHNKGHVMAKTIKTSSEWYPGFEKLLKQVLSSFYPEKIKKLAGFPKAKTRKKTQFRIKTLPGHKLTSIYELQIKDKLPLSSPFPEKVIVQVTTGLQAYKNKKITVATASFRTEKFATLKDPLSCMQLGKDKNDFKELTTTNITSSSIWYQPVNEVLKECLLQFETLNEKHDKMGVKSLHK